jgi:hypothetical protein
MLAIITKQVVNKIIDRNLTKTEIDKEAITANLNNNTVATAKIKAIVEPIIITTATLVIPLIIIVITLAT